MAMEAVNAVRDAEQKAKEFVKEAGTAAEEMIEKANAEAGEILAESRKKANEEADAAIAKARSDSDDLMTETDRQFEKNEKDFDSAVTENFDAAVDIVIKGLV